MFDDFIHEAEQDLNQDIGNAFDEWQVAQSNFFEMPTSMKLNIMDRKKLSFKNLTDFKADYES